MTISFSDLTAKLNVMNENFAMKPWQKAIAGAAMGLGIAGGMTGCSKGSPEQVYHHYLDNGKGYDYIVIDGYRYKVPSDVTEQGGFDFYITEKGLKSTKTGKTFDYNMLKKIGQEDAVERMDLMDSAGYFDKIKEVQNNYKQ